MYIVKWTLVVGLPAVAFMLLIDRLGYKRWVFPPYQFYLFNVHEGLATWFGESPPLYHLYVSMPILFTSMLPFVLHGAYLAFARGKTAVGPAVVAVAAMFVFSMVPHMEYRFLYPLLPIGFMYAAVSINSLVGARSGNLEKRPPKNSGNAGARIKGRRLWSTRSIVAYLLVTNVPASLYLNLVHQRGVIDAMAYLRAEAQSGHVEDIGFLMPCHSTPYYSHLHRPVPMWFLSCEPPLEKSALATHYWEANDFELDPVGFMHRIFDDGKDKASDVANLRYGPGETRRKPSHLVLYECMAKRIHQELVALGYGECASFFNSHFNGDARRKGDVVVYCRPPTTA
ncbi:glycosylphosphatidylinositol anchor biosynthesis [Coemansia sp. IMI 209128]|nr:glycosylphosphatidylinositol anchor biosynthesis [Coemansia sp. RSA 2530]KAJ2695445.1 glycosylphosphatidylinositol anchor biosynthesis [Coemansia sp. IMI 209128]